MPAARTANSVGITVDLEDFRTLARQLRKANVELNTEVRTSLRAIGMIVAEEAKAKASFSESIPPGIKVRLSGLSISVVSSVTPLGGLEEMGSKGSRSAGGTAWRHPVFGDRTQWVQQTGHPYLLPALEAKADEAEEAIAEVIGKVLDAALES